MHTVAHFMCEWIFAPFCSRFGKGDGDSDGDGEVVQSRCSRIYPLQRKRPEPNRGATP